MAEEKPSKRTKMALSESFDFTNMKTLDSTGLEWKNEPESFSLDAEAGLRMIPKPKTDFWRRTYQDPPADRASGHALLYEVPVGVQECTAQTVFTLKHQTQYDQAGVMVFIDDHHWLKAGIELEGGVPCMSCVVTNGESDWGYLVWPTAEDITIRVTIRRYPSAVCECKVEYMDEKGVWCFLRESPISLPGEGGEIKVGVTCCAPKKEKEGSDAGMEAIFKSLVIQGE